MEDSNNDIRNFLKDHGVEGTETMSQEDMEAFASALMTDDNNTNNNANTIVNSDVNISSNILNSQIQDNNNNNENSNEEDRNNSGDHSGDNGYEKTAASFVEITGCDPELAPHFLEAFGWDLETAVSMFVENPVNDSAPSNNNINNFSSPDPTVVAVNDAHIYDTPPITSMSEILASGMLNGEGVTNDNRVGDIPSIPNVGSNNNNNTNPGLPAEASDIMNTIQELMAQTSLSAANTNIHSNVSDRIYGFGNTIDEDEYVYEDNARIEEFDEAGVRRPDPVRKSRLLGPAAGIRVSRLNQDRDGLGGIDDPSVEWLFPPANKLSYAGSLEQARAYANSEGRWVLVNLQSHNEFTSHLLNRDTWTDETVESIVSTTFLLWQRGHTSPDGSAYMQTYKLNEDDLPHIAVIDPRTGAKKLQLTGFISPQDLSLRLVDFADQNDLGPNSSKASSRHSTSTDNITKMTSDNIENNETSVGKIGVADVSDERIESKFRDFGAVPEEPPLGEGFKVSIKLSNGKSLIRRYPPNTLVQSLFAVVVKEDNIVRESNASFDLITRFPMQSLISKLHQTLEECELVGSQVIFRWN